jgi:hypothetical protein
MYTASRLDAAGGGLLLLSVLPLLLLLLSGGCSAALSAAACSMQHTQGSHRLREGLLAWLVHRVLVVLLH